MFSFRVIRQLLARVLREVTAARNDVRQYARATHERDRALQARLAHLAGDLTDLHKKVDELKPRPQARKAASAKPAARTRRTAAKK